MYGVPLIPSLAIDIFSVADPKDGYLAGSIVYMVDDPIVSLANAVDIFVPSQFFTPHGPRMCGEFSHFQVDASNILFGESTKLFAS